MHAFRVKDLAVLWKRWHPRAHTHDATTIEEDMAIFDHRLLKCGGVHDCVNNGDRTRLRWRRHDVALRKGARRNQSRSNCGGEMEIVDVCVVHSWFVLHSVVDDGDRNNIGCRCTTAVAWLR